ncbi:RNA polymerase sigma factor [Planctomycetota bacterium]
MLEKNRQASYQAKKARFATTHWSVVRAAGKSYSAQQREAIETLCKSYWYPLYAFLRRRGHDSHQAEDLTQAFFGHLLEKKELETADPQYGKFRSFLLVRLKGFLSDQRDRANALKRGGGKKIISLSVKTAEGQYELESEDRLSPEMLFEKSWALTVLDRTMDCLESEMASANKQRVFEHLKVYLTAGKDTTPYEDMATELDMTTAAVRVAVHRLRRRYRRLLRDEISQTVGDKYQIDEEMECLFAALVC